LIEATTIRVRSAVHAPELTYHQLQSRTLAILQIILNYTSENKGKPIDAYTEPED